MPTLDLYIKQEIAFNVNVDEVIEKFKTLNSVSRKMEL